MLKSFIFLYPFSGITPEGNVDVMMQFIFSLIPCMEIEEPESLQLMTK
jgi:hypothetical protein